MKFCFFLALFTAVLFLAGCGDDEDKKSSDTPTEANATQPQSETEAVIQVDYTAPFTLQLSNGKILNMQKTKQGFRIDNNSTVTLFAFFTPWCDACAVQVSALNAAKQAYSGKLDIIGVMIGDASLDDAKAYASAHEVNYAIAYGEGTDFFTKALGGINEVPYIAIYDEKDEFSAQYFGLMPEEILMTELEKIF